MATSRKPGYIVENYVIAGDEQDTCDICGSHRDVAQVTCLMSGPEGDTEGYANLVFICSRCAAYIIQVTTGFRAVNTLDSWYHVRAVHARYRGERTHVEPEDGQPVD